MDSQYIVERLKHLIEVAEERRAAYIKDGTDCSACDASILEACQLMFEMLHAEAAQPPDTKIRELELTISRLEVVVASLKVDLTTRDGTISALEMELASFRESNVKPPSLYPLDELDMEDWN